MDSTALRRAFVAAVTLMITLAIAAGIARAQSGGELERSVKAAYLYKFLGYVEWPASAFASPADPVLVGVQGADDVALELARIAAGRKVDGRDITVVVLRRGEALPRLHALFVGRGEGARTAAALRAAHALPVLTITDADSGLDHGSVINFVRVGDNVRFEISVEATERNRLKLSSRLLAVASVVRTGPL